MLIGLSHNNEDSDERYTVLFVIWMWSHTPTRNPNPISTHGLDSRDEKWGEAFTSTPRAEALDDKCLQAQQQIEFYQARTTRAFNKKVKERTFKKGLILAVRRPMVMTHKTKGKFQPKWEGPFVVESVYLNGAYRLITSDGDTLMMPINGKFLKKYYPW